MADEKVLTSIEPDNPYIILDRCGDNCIKMNGKEYFGLRAQNVIVGISNGSQPKPGQITPVTDQGKEFYNPQKQAHSPWFLLDLETGGRGKYPGSHLYGVTAFPDVVVLADRNDNAEIIGKVLRKGTRAEIIEDCDNIYWYHCAFDNVTGYLRVENLENIHYE